MRVFILLTIRNKEAVFGNLCAFESLRKGFPASEIVVYDNASEICAEEFLPKYVTYIQIKERIEPDTIIESIVKTQRGSVCFVDPDTIFYENVEEKLQQISSELIAGRRVPSFKNKLLDTIDIERLHTSLLYVRNPRLLLKYIETVKQDHNWPYRPFEANIVFKDGVKYLYDTGANLYHMLEKRHVFCFSEEILSTYTHLNCGSMLDIVCKAEEYSPLRDIFEVAKRTPEKLRNLYKLQEDFYKQYSLNQP